MSPLDLNAYSWIPSKLETRFCFYFSLERTYFMGYVVAGFSGTSLIQLNSGLNTNSITIGSNVESSVQLIVMGIALCASSWSHIACTPAHATVNKSYIPSKSWFANPPQTIVFNCGGSVRASIVACQTEQPSSTPPVHCSGFLGLGLAEGRAPWKEKRGGSPIAQVESCA